MINRLLTTFILGAVTAALLTGCASRGGPNEGLAQEAEHNHETLARIIDSMPDTDPEKPRLIALLEDMGRHRERCYRFQHAWNWVQRILAAEEFFTGGVSFELRASGTGSAEAGGP